MVTNSEEMKKPRRKDGGRKYNVTSGFKYSRKTHTRAHSSRQLLSLGC